MSIFVILFASLISSTFADGVELFLRSSIYVDQADFALKLLRKSGDRSETSILSPFSVSVVLAMTYAGAKGNTRKQLNALLANDLEDEDFHNYFFELLESFRDFKNVEDFGNSLVRYPRCQLVSANKLFVQADADILVPFTEIINSKYFGQFEKVDFTQAEAVAKEINEWVENQTNSKIRELINSGMFNSDTFMVLVNAVYFKGNWLEEFRTEKKPFYHTENNVEEVDMMGVKESFPYYGNDNVEVLGLPYKGGQVLMYVFLPRQKNGLEAFEDSVNGDELLKLISNCSSESVIVNFPKFRIEKKFDLVPTLKKMGITDAFSKRDADFSALSTLPLRISNVVHKAFIDVDEMGTEAAAVTGVRIIEEECGRIEEEPKEPIHFIADHPFMFAIVKGKTVLFIGRYF